MKEATGELNMTVVTIIAIGAIIAFFWVMWPKIQKAITDQWDDISDDGSKDGTQYHLNENIVLPTIW